MRLVLNPQDSGEPKTKSTSNRAPERIDETVGLTRHDELQRFAEYAYAQALNTHGDLGLCYDAYAARLVPILSACLVGRTHATEACIPKPTVTQLHTSDLYLALACVQGSETGWIRFNVSYKRYLQQLAARFDRTCDPVEVADAIAADLWLPDRSGRPRIASYDCRYSLGTWLRAIVHHRMTNEMKRKTIAVESLETVADAADESALYRLEADVNEARYATAIRDSLRNAATVLSAREVLILRLIYKMGLTRTEVAARLGVNCSTVNYHERRINDKLRVTFTSTLKLKYHLPQAAVDECVAEAASNPAYSLLALVAKDKKG